MFAGVLRWTTPTRGCGAEVDRQVKSGPKKKTRQTYSKPRDRLRGQRGSRKKR